MRTMTVINERLENGRIRYGEYATDYRDGPRGAFKLIGPKGTLLVILSSGVDLEYGWEHVSVSCERRTPNWAEMCWVKDLFWSENECVVQYHPSRSEYVDHHPNCLHLWRPLRETLPVPPSILVGPKSAGD